jgi:hypothetical protein
MSGGIALLAALGCASALGASTHSASQRIGLRTAVFPRARPLAAADISITPAQPSAGADDSPFGATGLAQLRLLKTSGGAPNFDSLRLAPRLVAQQELTRVTKIDPELLLGGAPLDYAKLLYGTLGGSSILGLAAMSATVSIRLYMYITIRLYTLPSVAVVRTRTVCIS